MKLLYSTHIANYLSTIFSQLCHNRIKHVKITKSNNAPDDTAKFSTRPSLVVVKWLIDDACNGFAFDSNANQHRGMIE